MLLDTNSKDRPDLIAFFSSLSVFISVSLALFIYLFLKFGLF